MRLGLALGVGATTLAASIAGCTLLIPFDEAPQDAGVAIEASAGGDADAAVSQDAAKDADAAPPPFPPPCDPTFPLTQVACNGATLPSCAKRAAFASYPAGYDRANDLVLCNGGPTPSCVEHCPFGCAEMPSGFPDQCDDCNGRADGYYCGRDLRAWDSASADLAVECKAGRAVRGAICGVNKCASMCPRPSPLPSCCIP